MCPDRGHEHDGGQGSHQADGEHGGKDERNGELTAEGIAIETLQNPLNMGCLVRKSRMVENRVRDHRDEDEHEPFGDVAIVAKHLSHFCFMGALCGGIVPPGSPARTSFRR